MGTIVFKLKDGTAAGEAGASLKEICSIAEVFNVKAVFPGEEMSGKRLAYTADVAAGASTKAVLAAIKAAPHVEYAQVPPVRSRCDVH
jgi:hypothetical protein